MNTSNLISGGGSSGQVTGSGGVNTQYGSSAVFGAATVTKYTLTYISINTYSSPVAISKNALVFYNGMLQNQGIDYTISGQNVVFAGTWNAADNVVLFQ